MERAGHAKARVQNADLACDGLEKQWRDSTETPIGTNTMMKSHLIDTNWKSIPREVFTSLTRRQRFAVEVCTAMAKDAEMVATMFLKKGDPKFMIVKERGTKGDVEFAHYQASGDARH